MEIRTTPVRPPPEKKEPLGTPGKPIETKELKNTTIEENSKRMVGEGVDNNNKDETGTAPVEETGTLPASTPAKPIRLRPALRGHLKRDAASGAVKWDGLWGMDDSAFDGGITSSFSYTRTEIVERQNSIPASVTLAGEPASSDILKNAIFSGYFNMVVNGRTKRVVEKNVLMEFRGNGDDESCTSVTVRGSGANAFGTYVLEGTLVLKTGELNVYREYTGPPPANLNAKTSKSSTRGSSKPASKTKRADAPPAAAPVTTSSAPKPKTPSFTASVPASKNSLLLPSRNQRMRRTPSHLVEDMLDEKEAEDLIKLKNIVREIYRADREGWFAAPVDPEALGLHNYRDIIKNPMDLGTVLKKFDLKEYRTHEEALEDVRLTFNNAMTYNPQGTGVHISAKRLLDMFETSIQRQLSSFRQLKAKKRKKGTSVSSGGEKSGGSSKRAKTSKSSAEQKASLSEVFGSSDEEGGAEDDDSSDDEVAAVTPSPSKKKVRRQSNKQEVATEDVSGLKEQIEKMQKQIQMMTELHGSLLSQQQGGHLPLVSQQIHAPPPKPTNKPRRSSEPRPLTYQEMRQLGEDINKLPPDMIEGVVKIIQESGTALGEDEDGEEVEFELEALDTPALKKLQKYVKRCLTKARSKQAQEAMY